MSKDNQANKERGGKPFVTQVEGKNIDVVLDDVLNPPVNPMAQPQPINALSDATITVSDKTVPRANITADPIGSRRLADEQAAGKASLERKHGVNQLEKESEAGKKAANKGR